MQDKQNESISKADSAKNVDSETDEGEIKQTPNSQSYSRSRSPVKRRRVGVDERDKNTVNHRDLFKTAICNRLPHCRAGDQCNYAHSQSEIRRVSFGDSRRPFNNHARKSRSGSFRRYRPSSRSRSVSRRPQRKRKYSETASSYSRSRSRSSSASSYHEARKGSQRHDARRSNTKRSCERTPEPKRAKVNADSRLSYNPAADTESADTRKGSSTNRQKSAVPDDHNEFPTKSQNFKPRDVFPRRRHENRHESERKKISINISKGDSASTTKGGDIETRRQALRSTLLSESNGKKTSRNSMESVQNKSRKNESAHLTNSSSTSISRGLDLQNSENGASANILKDELKRANTLAQSREEEGETLRKKLSEANRKLLTVEGELFTAKRALENARQDAALHLKRAKALQDQFSADMNGQFGFIEKILEQK